VLSLLNQYIEWLFRNWRLGSGIMGVLMFSTTLVFYIKAFINLRRYTRLHALHNFNAARYKKSLNTMAMVLVWLFVCCIPLLSTQYILAKSEYNKFYGILDYTSVVVYSINSCTNPVIFFVRFTDIRDACRENIKGVVGH